MEVGRLIPGAWGKREAWVLAEIFFPHPLHTERAMLLRCGSMLWPRVTSEGMCRVLLLFGVPALADFAANTRDAACSCLQAAPVLTASAAIAILCRSLSALCPRQTSLLLWRSRVAPRRAAPARRSRSMCLSSMAWYVTRRQRAQGTASPAAGEHAGTHASKSAEIHTAQHM